MSKKLDVELIGGGAVKSDGGNRFAGYGIVFSNEFSPDCDEEFFNSSSNFWLEDRISVPVLFSHGRDATVGKERLGTALWSKDEKGIFFSGELEDSEHTSDIMALVRSGALGFSSAALSPWVDRVPVPPSVWLATWPIYELSLTSQACEVRTRATALKNFHPTPLLKCSGQASRFERARQRSRELALRAIAQDPEAFSEADRRSWGATTDWLREQQRKRSAALDHYGKKQAEGLAEVARLKERYESLIADEESKRQQQLQDQGRRSAMRVRWNG